MENDLICRGELLRKVQPDDESDEKAKISVKTAKNMMRTLTKSVPAVDAVDAVDADKALEWLEGYTFTDTKQVYTNGTVLVPLFRVRQALKDKAYNGLREG